MKRKNYQKAVGDEQTMIIMDFVNQTENSPQVWWNELHRREMCMLIIISWTIASEDLYNQNTPMDVLEDPSNKNECSISGRCGN